MNEKRPDDRVLLCCKPAPFDRLASYGMLPHESEMKAVSIADAVYVIQTRSPGLEIMNERG